MEVRSASQSTDCIDMSTKEGYDLWSQIYDEEDNPLVRLENVEVSRLLGNVAGLKILDVGCGTGRYTLTLAQSGADVTGIDFSDGMLAKARAKVGAEHANFVQHDLSHPLPFAKEHFDGVICCLVLDHIPNLDALFSEMASVSKLGGFILVSVMHPAMNLIGVQARFTDPTTGRVTRPESAFHKLSDYVMAGIRARLHIEHLSEHIVDDVLAGRSPRAAKYRGWPLLAVMLLRKPA